MVEREHFARLMAEWKAVLAAEEAERKRREEEEKEKEKVAKNNGVEKDEIDQAGLPTVDGETRKEAVEEASSVAPVEVTEAGKEGLSVEGAVADGSAEGKQGPGELEKQGGDQGEETEAGKRVDVPV